MDFSSSRESEGPDSSHSVCRAREDRLPDPPLLLNRQRAIRADWGEVEDFLRLLFSRLAQSSFGVCLLSDTAIRRYNRRFRQENHATDVLSFPAGKRGAAGSSYLGDILISVETARHNARRYGLRVEEEIKVLALHGLLHLLGYDHETDGGQMARLERRWSSQLGLSRSLTDRAGKRPTARRSPSRHWPDGMLCIF